MKEEKNNFKIREDYFHSSWWLAAYRVGHSGDVSNLSKSWRVVGQHATMGGDTLGI